MEETLKVLNQMEADGLIGRYAIGGAVAATVYVEPMQTFDLDIFSGDSYFKIRLAFDRSLSTPI